MRPDSIILRSLDPSNADRLRRMGLSGDRAERLTREIEETPLKLPRHLAIIMDGNGRWAEQRSEPRAYGHKVGYEVAGHLVAAAADLGIEHLTLYAFSRENWNRPREEVDYVMSLFSRFVDLYFIDALRDDRTLIRAIEACDRLHFHGQIRSIMEALSDEEKKKIVSLGRKMSVRFIGRLQELPRSLAAKFEMVSRMTRNNPGMVLTLAASYSGRAEISDAVKALGREIKAGLLDPEQIDEESVRSKLYTAELPDPDLLIRTSGEKRLSNFMLWQSSYTELHVCPKYWPDFDFGDLLDALLDYSRRERRFGSLPSRDSSASGRRLAAT